MFFNYLGTILLLQSNLHKNNKCKIFYILSLNSLNFILKIRGTKLKALTANKKKVYILIIFIVNYLRIKILEKFN